MVDFPASHVLLRFRGANLRFARVEDANLNLKNYVAATEQKKQPRILAFLPAAGEKFFLTQVEIISSNVAG